LGHSKQSAAFEFGERETTLRPLLKRTQLSHFEPRGFYTHSRESFSLPRLEKGTNSFLEYREHRSLGSKLANLNPKTEKDPKSSRDSQVHLIESLIKKINLKNRNRDNLRNFKTEQKESKQTKRKNLQIKMMLLLPTEDQYVLTNSKVQPLRSGIGTLIEQSPL